MKSLIISASLLVSMTSVQAQFTVGPELSLIGTNYTGKVDGQSGNTKSVISFRAGAVVNAPIGDHFDIQPAVMYVQNGSKSDVVFSSATAHVNTLEVPVNVMYKINTTHGEHFFVGLGPYIAYNMSGKTKFTSNFSGTGAETQTISFGSDAHDNMKTIDLGLGINVGYQLLNGLFLRVYYQKGLVNLFPQGNTENSIYSTNYGVGLGMLFGGHNHAKTKPQAKKQ